MKLAPLVAAGAAALVLVACDHGPSAIAPNASPVSLTIVSGNSQSAPVNTRLSQPVRVRVLNSSGQPVPNFAIDFVVTTGGGSVFGGAEVTDASGYADELWTLGPRLGAQTLAARSVNASTGAAVTYGTFTATATPPNNVLVVGKNATGIFVMNADGSGVKQVTTNPADTMPGLSPDHKKVAFFSTAGSGRAVYLVHVDGTGRRIISSGVCNETGDPPHFSPDGNLILYVALQAGPDCGVTAVQGVQIVDTLGNVNGGFRQPGTDMGGSSWRADGEQFYYASNEFGDGQNVFGSSVEIYRDNFINVTAGPELTRAFDVIPIAASPDGLHIAFFGNTNPGSVSPGFVYVMNTDGSVPKSVTNALGLGGVLSYSPDGTLIAIDHGIMNADGSSYTVVKGCPCQFTWK